MIEQKEKVEAAELANIAILGMQEKKAISIVDMDLTNIKNAVCEHFIICHGTSSTHLSAIADAVEEFIKKATGQNAWHKEGYQNAEWILLDYVNVVVHVFNEQTRRFYNLEGLWADSKVTRIEE